jgi:hypothetical protein
MEIADPGWWIEGCSFIGNSAEVSGSRRTMKPSTRSGTTLKEPAVLPSTIISQSAGLLEALDGPGSIRACGGARGVGG